MSWPRLACLSFALLVACSKTPTPAAPVPDAPSAVSAPDTSTPPPDTAQAGSTPAPDVAPDGVAPGPSLDASPALPDAPRAPPSHTEDPAGLTLLQPGAEPRRPIRYTTPSAPTALPLALTLTLTVTSDGQPMQLPIPPFSLTLSATPAESSPGALTLAVTRAGTLPPEPGGTDGTTLGQILRSLEGLTGERTLTARGLGPATRPLFSTEGRPAALAPVIEGFAQSVDQLVVPLPREPLGAGARWVSRLPVHQHGAAFEQVTTWTLVSLNEGALSLSYEVHLKLADAPPASLTGPLTGKLERVDGSGTGTVLLAIATGGEDVALPSPLPMRVTGENSVTLTVETHDPTRPDGPPKKLEVKSRLTLATADGEAPK